MAHMIVQELASNAALLLVLGFGYVQVFRRWQGGSLVGQAINGVLFGAVAIAVMLNPLHLLEGVVFDTRSVVISVGGLFGGPWAAAIAFVMASAFRVSMGGAGALMGVLVSFFSAALGAAFFLRRKHAVRPMGAAQFYLFGLLVHLVMLACTLALPGDLTRRVLSDIGLPVIVVYPLATLLLCLLIADREQRIATERQLVESEDRYRRLVDTASEGIWAIDDQRRTTFVNARMAKLLGYAPQEMIGRGLEEFVVPEELADLDQQMSLRRQGQATQYERRLKTKDGGFLWTQVSASPMYENGVYVGSMAMYTDISGRKRTEELTQVRLRLLEAAAVHPLKDLLRMTLDEVCALTNSPIGFYHFVDADQKTLSLQAWSTKTRNELCSASGEGKHYDLNQAGVWVDCVHERRPVIHNDYHALPHRKGLPPGHAPVLRELVTPIQRQDKIVAILGVGNKPSLYTNDDVGTVTYLADLAWEMAERKRAEEASRLSQEKFSKAFKASPIWVAISSLAEGRFLEVNDAFTVICGYTREEALGRTSADLGFWLDPDDRRKALEVLDQQGSFRNRETLMRFKDDKVHVMLWSAHRLAFEDQDCIISVLMDITDQKEAQDARTRLEAQLRQAQKMEAIGTLAGGIAHDFNNILGSIMGYAELAQELERNGRPHQQELAQVLRSAERARDLVRQILTFSRKAEADLRPLSLNKTVRLTLQMLEHSLPKMIAIETHLEPGLHLVNADPNQMGQVVINLATNAADAMPEGGRLVLETQNVTLNQAYSDHHLDLPPGEYVLLMVSDTGHGMDARTMEQVFDPFFTTKGVGKGTGLGLSTVYGIVKAHGGQVYCYSEPGLGATFKVYLPVHGDDAPQPSQRQELPQQLLRGAETILLVDDEQTLRELGRQVLEDMGYAVLTAASGEDALAIYQSQGQSVDLVVMDLGMPGMGGHKALRAILELDPQARVIIASGYSANGQVKASLEAGGAGYVAKPYRRLDLLSTVRAVLDGK